MLLTNVLYLLSEVLPALQNFIDNVKDISNIINMVSRSCFAVIVLEQKHFVLCHRAVFTFRNKKDFLM